MLSFITPPVALGAFAAASIAKASPIATGFAAMRLGTILYFLPFIFVLDPNFILQGSWYGAVQVFVEALIGIWLLAGALQGYLPGLGLIVVSYQRAMLAIAGLLVALPGLTLLWPNSVGNLPLLGAGMALACVALAWRYGTNLR